MPKLILQPDDYSCGQCCVAMATGMSLQKVMAFTGHDPDGMSTADVRRALLRFGVYSARRMHPAGTRGLGSMHDGRAILHTAQRPTPKFGHWVLLWDGGIYDPAGARTALHYPTDIVSYLRIHRVAGGPYVEA